VTAARPAPVAAARELAPLAAGLAAQTERERRLAPALSDALVDAGLYRLCVPASLGGGEAPPAVLIDAIATLAAGDAAAGWCLAVSSTSGMLAAYLPAEGAAEVYGDPRAVAGGVFAPSGRAVAGDGAFTVSGRWSFCSNVDACDWVMGGCVVLDGETPRRLAGGRPDIRLAVLPAGEVEVLDTWHVSGLRGTGSHDVRVEGAAVPAARTASLLSDRPREPGPLYAFPPFGLLAIALAAVALGAARGALDDVVELAGAKVPTLSTRRLVERATVQAAMARAEAGLRAARAGLDAAVAHAWAAAADGGAIPTAGRAGLRMAATHAVEAAAATVDAAWSMAGGSAIREESPLQRRFRDVHAATQHMMIAPTTWELTGRVLLGVETDEAQL
jgi:alkylation response protein AidB-like acyl-CoA dehydrogenase